MLLINVNMVYRVKKRDRIGGMASDSRELRQRQKMKAKRSKGLVHYFFNILSTSHPAQVVSQDTNIPFLHFFPFPLSISNLNHTFTILVKRNPCLCARISLQYYDFKNLCTIYLFFSILIFFLLIIFTYCKLSFLEITKNI